MVGFFDNIDHGILLDLLSQKIDDERFLRLIEGMLKAGYMENWSLNATYPPRWASPHRSSPIST